MKNELETNAPVAVIGGTGKAGRYLVGHLIQQTFPIRLLVRRPDHEWADHPLVTTIVGDARDEHAILLLTRGCRAVISTLGQPKGESPIFYDATQHVLKAMQQYGIRRYILVGGLSIDVPGDEKSAGTLAKTDWMKANFPTITDNRQQEFQLLSGSMINWTMVRLPMIEQTAVRSNLVVRLTDCPGDQIGTIDLAVFLVSLVDDTRYFRQAPFIASEGA